MSGNWNAFLNTLETRPELSFGDGILETQVAICRFGKVSTPVPSLRGLTFPGLLDSLINSFFCGLGHDPGLRPNPHALAVASKSEAKKRL
jgi:hypothetical protein